MARKYGSHFIVMIMKIIFSIFFVLSLVYTSFAQSADNISEFDVNGLKVIFKRRPSSPTVSAGLFVRGGVRNLTAKNAGIEELTLAAASESSKKFPREALRKELARTGSVIGAGSSYDFSVISLSATKPHFDRTWQIFTDVVRNPSFTEEDVALIRERMLTVLRNQATSPDSALNLLNEKVIYANHPYANNPNGTIETISGLEASDLQAYHKGLLQTSRLLLVIVGDLDLATVRKQVTDSFGTLPRGDYKEQPLARLNFAQGTVDVTSRPLQTNYVKGVFAAPSLTDPDYHAMRVAMTILQGRVYQEVRVERQLSYAPNAEMGDHAANTGHIYVTAADANQAVGIMLREIEDMKKNPVPEENFTGIPGFYLTTYYISQERNAAQVAELARYELIGGGWRNSLKFLDEIRKVTPGDVQAAANKYMKNLRFVVVGDPNAVNKSTFLPGD